MKASLVSATSPRQRRSHYLSATVLARAGAWGAWPAGLVALPLALAPTGASAATIVICPPTGGGVCNASTVLGSAKNSDVLDFLGGTLTLDVASPSPQTYPQKATLETLPPSSTPNKLDQDSHNTAFTGVFSGSGNIDVGNTGSGGSVTFNAKNTYTGSTTVESGANLKLGTKGTIATSSTLADNGTFDISGAGGNVTIKDLSGSGTVTLGGNTLILSAAGSMFAGGISGKGGLTVSGGTETLLGDNIYTGATTINTGATLSITGTGSIASSSKVTDNGAFDISGAKNDVTIKALGGSGTVKLGGNSVILSNAGATTFSGVISGAGGVTVEAGAETFTNTNKYSGTTTINSGAALLLTKTTGSISNSSVVNDGSLDISGTKGTSIISLSGTTGTVALGNQVLTLSNASGIFAGSISGSGKNSGLMINAGTETLNGTSTFSGATTVSPGATLMGKGTISGALVNNGTVKPFNPVTNSPETFTVGGNYSQITTNTKQPSSLTIAIGGTTVGTYGRLSVSGTVLALDGGLDVELVNSFLFPQGTTTYDILEYGKLAKNAGDFSSVSLDHNACTADGPDKWICGVGLTFTESFTSDALDLVVAQTPEPGTLAILASGLLGLLGLRRRWTRCPR
ncbi:MAG TPA: PEP-CTERM sorting domain-containing protein [Acetobacteraceae bacterium]|nr:PEP-CTERM sorting domain-containing protein [Acetobacteraceae bacterium]